jgi:hypothetical protein
MRNFTVFVFLAGFMLMGCGALREAQEKREKKIKIEQQERYLTFERPASEVKASDDGLVIESDHYVMTFDNALLKHKDFDESEERKKMGTGALVFMESLYNFVHDIFGFQPGRRIHVILYETFQGTTALATTQVSYKTTFQNGELVRTVDNIQMNFPLAMFNQRDVRAHELTHAFTQIYFLPTWFAEGIAVYVQLEHAKGDGRGKVDLYSIKLDFDGVNAVQTWRGHSDAIGALSSWGYDYSYSLVSELKQRFGDRFYPELFRLVEQDKLHQKLVGPMSTSMLVYYMSQAAGQDLAPFFEELKFSVRRLTREEILAIIQQGTQ